MTAANKNILMIGGVLIAGVLIYRMNKKKSTETASGFSNAGGLSQCSCYRTDGTISHRRCNMKMHPDCISCCGLHNDTPTNEGVLNNISRGSMPRRVKTTRRRF